ncbi:hypothetical protein [Aureispira anguillae]|uniref:Lipoprotein n=1 Tax=Aureispira anguillae TaxID=2864201 RepID=A0A916DQV5_9BACT|nr:hypothetical protein [Aureispira anguillae]BDS10300.1 hypothetical protein AsAng_0010080 [Aureispira anguillae]
MNKTLFYNIVLTTLLSIVLVGCGSDAAQVVVNEQGSVSGVYAENALETSATKTTPDEEMTISVPIQEHEIRIVRAKNEQKQAKLSDANVKELESWWDSLPKPVQSQIKAKKIDIEVVSKIRTNDKQDINPQLNDSQIENTGETLEQIIGKETEMKYTVSTTLIDGQKNPQEGEHATNIRLVKQVPVKLQKFTADIFIRENDVNNDNIRTLQYWWTNLPQDVRNKIKRREIVLDVVCHTVEDIDGARTEDLAAAEDFAAVMGDVLNRMVGVYKAGKKEYSLAQIKTATQLEKATAKNLKLPAKQYIKISLRKNKAFIPNSL